MEKLELTIPYNEVDNISKVAKRIAKYVKGFSFEVGNPYEKVYYHPVMNSIKYDMFNPLEKWHKVVDITITRPKVQGWRIIATFVDGNIFIADKRKEVVFKDGHGEDYYLCDVCKHKQTNIKSFIIRNENDEELQVGCECIKKFGLDGFQHLYKFEKALYEVYGKYDNAFDSMANDIEVWPFKEDKYAYSSIHTKVLIAAAKKTFDNNKGAWVKKYYDNSEKRWLSPTAEEIVLHTTNRDLEVNEDYWEKVLAFGKALDANNDFSKKLKEWAIECPFYSKPNDGYIAYFLIKLYEESLQDIQEIECGSCLKVDGKLLDKHIEDGYYGFYNVYEILTNKGMHIVINSSSKLPIGENKIVCNVYTIANFQRGNKVYCKKVLKNPKKGANLIEV